MKSEEADEPQDPSAQPLTRFEREIERRQSIGRQLYAVLVSATERSDAESSGRHSPDHDST